MNALTAWFLSQFFLRIFHEAGISAIKPIFKVCLTSDICLATMLTLSLVHVVIIVTLNLPPFLTAPLLKGVFRFSTTVRFFPIWYSTKLHFGAICQRPHLWCDKTTQQLWQPICLRVRFFLLLGGASPLPFSDVFGSLQEASVVILLQWLLSLRDEGRRALDALLAVRNLLSQFSQPHHLEWKHRKAVMSLRSQIMVGFAIQR